MNSNKTNPVRSTISATRPLARPAGTSIFATSARLLLAAALAAFAAALAPQPAAAGTYYWDANGTTAGFGTAGGTWGTSAFWTGDSAGSGTTSNYTTTVSDTLYFGTATLGLAAGTVTVSGTQNFGTINAGTVSGKVTFSGGALNISGGANIICGNTSGPKLVFGEVIGGSGGLTIAGDVQMSAVNTYSGGTILANGAFYRNSIANSLPANQDVTVQSGGTLTTMNVNLNIGTGILYLTGTGNGSGAFYDGNNGGSPIFTGGGIVLQGNTTIGPKSGNMTLNAAISGNYALSKINNAAIILPVANTYTGGTTNSAGTIEADNNSALGTGLLTMNGGTLSNNVSSTLTSAVNLVAANSKIGVGSGQTLGLSGIITNTGALTKLGSGTLALSGNNTFSGGVTVSNGVLEADSNTALGTSLLALSGGGLSNNVSSTVANNVNLNVDSAIGVGSGQTLTLSGAVTNTGALTKSGTGTLVLSGTTSYGGATTVNGGVLQVSGSLTGPVTVNSAGSLTLGSGGGTATLAVNNALTNSGTIALRINKTGGIVTNDVIKGLTAVNYGGTLTVANVTSDGHQIALGDLFQLFNASSYSGSFATVTLPTLPSGLSWDASGLAVNGTIAVTNNTATPTFNPPGGGYAGAVSVTISSETGATVYYTTDGSDPTTSGTVQSGASPMSVTVPLNTVNELIRAYATKPSRPNSEVASATYSTVTMPTWLNAGGGTWSTTANWSNTVVANAANVTADFSQLDISGSVTVNVNSTFTVGNLIFGDTDPIGSPGNWILSNNSVPANTLTLAATNPTVTVNTNCSATISAVLAGTNGLTVTGNGTLALSAANSYSGTTMLNSGILQVGANSALGSGLLVMNGGIITNSGNFTLPNPINLNSNAVFQSSAQFLTLSGPITNTGSLTVVGNSGSSWVQLSSASNTYSGGTFVNGGLLGLGVNNCLPMNQNVTVNSGATLYMQNYSVNIGSGTLYVSGPGSGTGGAIYANNNAANVVTANSIVLQGNTIFGQKTGSLKLAGPISDGGSGYAVSKINAGTLILTGTNTYSGGTTNSAGTVEADTSSALGTGLLMMSGGALSCNVSSTLTNDIDLYVTSSTINVGSGQTLTLGGNLFDAGGLTKGGAGTLALTGNNAFTGTTTIGGGVLQAAGSLSGAVTVNSGGTLAVGSGSGASTLAVNSGLTLNSGGTVTLRISKTGGMATNDVIQTTSSISYAGVLTVANVTSDATQLAAGDSFQLFNASGGYGGSFDSTNLPTLSSGLAWDTSGLTVNGSVAVIASTATPTFNPPAGGYVGAVSVTITSDSGSTIHYTTDGSDPASSGTVQTGASPVTVVVPVNTVNEVITAYATKAGQPNSGEASATYATVARPTWVVPASGTWSTAGNWSNNVPASGANVTADFSTLDITSDTTVSLDTPVVIGNLSFADTDPTNTPANWILDNSGNTANILVLAATNPTVTVGSMGSNDSVTISAYIAGTSGLTKAGPGTLTLSGVNTFTGGTTVNAGTIAAAGGNTSKGTLGNGNITVNNGGTISVSSYGTLTGYNPLSSIALTINSGGTVTNSGGSQNLCPVVLNGGTMSAGTPENTYGNWSFWYGVYATNGHSSQITGGKCALGQSGGTVFNVGASDTLTVSAVLAHLSSDTGLIKNGSGTLTLSAANTYTNTTTVSSGTLLVNGSLAGGSAVTVNGGTLGGTGTINGPTTIQVVGKLAIGQSIGTLTISNSLALAGSVTMKLDKGNGTNDSVVGVTNITYGGTLALTNLTGTLANGDSFKLFTAATGSGSFASITPATPGAGLLWNFNPSSGVLSVVPSVNTNPTNITFTVTGGTLSLSWPADHTGWTLMAQTNTLGVGLVSATNAWFPVAGSAATNVWTVPVDATKPTVFYRLQYP